MIENKIRLNSKFRFQWEQAQQCHVLLYPEGLIKLNKTAAEIISRCQQSTTVQFLIDDLSASFPEAEGLADDVKEFILDAQQQEWIVGC